VQTRARLRHRSLTIALLLLLLLVATGVARADEERAALRQRGHHKKVVGAWLIGVGTFLDLSTTALTFTGLARGGWSLTPKEPTDQALLYTGVVGNFVLDSILTAGIVVYCDGGVLMRRADQGR
jgi:uncharacterized membrane protein